MRNFLRQYGFLLMIPFLVVACRRSTGDSSWQMVDLPEVDILCSSAQASDCGFDAGGATAYVGFIDNENIVCRQYMEGMNNTDFFEAFEASGSNGVFNDGSETVGTIANWREPSGVPTDTLLNRDYRLCAFIDTNGNEKLDADEPVGETLVTLGDDVNIVEFSTFWEDM